MKLIAATLGLLLALQPPRADDIAARLHAYLLTYEPKLSELIADESMRQQIDRAGSIINNSMRREQRDLTSEVAFIALPANAGWMGFRRVLKVGRDPVEDGTGSLKEVLSSGEKTEYAKAKEMLANSARFNLGSPRTTNLPNMPLEMLHPRHAKRFSVRLAGEERIRGVKLVRLVFLEIFSPTIIRENDGGDLRSIVTAFVEPANGRLHRADVFSRDPRPNAWPFDAVVSVDFAIHREFGLLVPTKMREEFFAGHDRRAWGEASYTNYRRFQTSARILPQ